MKNSTHDNCKKCKHPRVRQPWQPDPFDQNTWGWMTYCEHCHHLSSFSYDENKPLPSESEIEETIKKYRAWM